MVLYHYTTLQTLCSIVGGIKGNNMFLRAGNARNMNDPNDCYYFTDEIGKMISCKNEDLDQIYKAKNQFNQPYIISLSARKDDLHMWNCYGCDGKGVALGFTKADLEECARVFFEKNHTSAKLSKCLYASSSQIKNNLQLATLINGGNYIEKSFWDDQYFLDLANIIKHPCYKYEKEYRIIILHGDKEITINEVYRSQEDAFYFNVPLDMVKKIIVGPNADFDSIKVIFKNYFPKADFICSEIPYRSK